MPFEELEHFDDECMSFDDRDQFEDAGVSLAEIVARPDYVPEHDEHTIPPIAVLNEWWESDTPRAGESFGEWQDRRSILQFLSLATVPRVAQHLSKIGAVLMSVETSKPVDVGAHIVREAKSTRITGQDFHRKLQRGYDETFRDILTEEKVKVFLERYGMYAI